MTARCEGLALHFIADVGSGKLAVGSSLPSEVELAAQHGVSRTLLRSALPVVQDLGLISRRQRAGIRIEAAKPPRAYERSISGIEDLTQFAVVTECHVKDIGTIGCDQALAARLECEVDQTWLRVELLRIHSDNPDQPICWTDVYLDPVVGAAVRNQQRKSSGLICEMVEERFGGAVGAVGEVKQEIRAIGVPARIAGMLAAEPGSHALEVTRRYVDRQGLAFEITVIIYPADRFTYSLQLRRRI